MRTALLDRAAEMLRRREPVTLRAVVEGTGASTMAVYTHFGSMDGLWSALRQEGFRRLAAAGRDARPGDDPVGDAARLASAYLRAALDHPDVYRVMFDASVPLEDPEAADQLLAHLADALARARDAGRLRPDADPELLATHVWTVLHGFASLVTSGALAREVLDTAPDVLVAVLTAAGDDPPRCRASLLSGWDLQR